MHNDILLPNTAKSPKFVKGKITNKIKTRQGDIDFSGILDGFLLYQFYPQGGGSFLLDIHVPTVKLTRSKSKILANKPWMTPGLLKSI